jgi:molybdopterin converting factor subunit 1
VGTVIEITALFFAHYQDIVGRREQSVSVPEGCTIAELARRLEGQYPGLAGLMTHGRVAVNAEFADGDTVLHGGDEIAWMPPMSGGHGGG